MLLLFNLSAIMPDIDFNTMNDSKSDIGSDESELIDLQHYRNLVRTYIDMVCSKDCLDK